MIECFGHATVYLSRDNVSVTRMCLSRDVRVSVYISVREWLHTRPKQFHGAESGPPSQQ